MTDDPGLTRREALGGVAAAGAGVMLGPVAGAAARGLGPAGGERVFSRWVGHLRAGVSPTIAVRSGFTLAGVQWAGPETPRIELRTRVGADPWGPWALASVRGHDGDGRETGPPTPPAQSAPPRPGGQFGEPLWTGRADRLQLRADGPVGGVRLHFVVTPPAGGARPAAADGIARAAASPPLATPVLPAGPGQPPVIARSAWAGRRHPPTSGPFYSAVDLAFVHHTVNPNGYSRGDVPALIAGIYDYHVHVRHYFDIGYNFVIDAFGRIWEARAGGIDEPVIGAHAGGYNAESTGIAMLGTFMDTVPPPSAIAALQRLLAWKLSLHGLPALGDVRVQVAPSGASYTRFRPGQRVSLPRIAGHRDGDQTDCPGSALYRHLPQIRPRVAALGGVPAVLTLRANPARTVAGTAVTLGGRLTRRGGAPIAGASVQITAVGSEVALTTATSGADGRFTTSVTRSTSTVLRALHRARPAAVSGVVVLEVAPVVTLALSSTSPPRVTGTVSPAKRTVTLDVYRQLPAGGRRRVASTRIAAHGGRFAARVHLGARPGGAYAVVAHTTADDANTAGASPPVRFTA